jgi:copper chaperone CopZ
MTDIRLHIDGMKCEGCAAAVTEALESVPGVESAEVSLDDGSARVAAGGTVAMEALARAVESAGYGARAGA